jgi:hypothetical protein
MLPGDPTSLVASFTAANAPLVPTWLSVEMAPLTPALLSKVWSGAVLSDAPNVTFVTWVPVESKIVTASLVVLSPTPDPL